MSQEQDQNRNEQATPYKLEQARKQGQTAKSQDVSAVLALAVAVVVCYGLAQRIVQGLAGVMARILETPTSVLDATHGSAMLTARAMEQVLAVMAPLLLGLVVMAVVGGAVQGGFGWSTKPLKPDWNRINPMAGFKRLWSIRLLYEALKNSLKLTGLFLVTLLALKALVPKLGLWLQWPAKALPFHLADAVADFLVKLCAVLLVFALVDLLFARWNFLRQMRMSKREILDEHKQRDGDPRIKSRQRELRLRFLQRSRSVQQVAGATVVVTNPTHIAVALKYDHGTSPAPQVVAKGAGVLAAAIRHAAYRSGVPVVHSPQLARALFKGVPDDGFVPQQWYPPVARILVWLKAQRDLQQRLQQPMRKASA